MKTNSVRLRVIWCLTTVFLTGVLAEGTLRADHSLCVVSESACLAFNDAKLQVELGFGDRRIAGAQFSISYDPATLNLVDISPGATCDPSSPFTMELVEQVDEIAGEVFYAVGISPAAGQSPTTGPATVACIEFELLSSEVGEVCIFEGVNPQNLLLADEFGELVPVDNSLTCPVVQPLPTIACANVLVDENCVCEPGSNLCDDLDSICGDGVCDELTGFCRVEPINTGGDCDDGDACTRFDRCFGGECRGSQCDNPSLCFAETSCVGDGLLGEVSILLGAGSATILGGQFSISYDPSLLDFVDIAPGATCDFASPFSQELFRTVDEVSGTIFYAVGVALGDAGTTGPSTMACITFIGLEPDRGDLCLFNNNNPMLTLLVGETGQSVGINNAAACPTDVPDPAIACAELCTVPTVTVWGLLILFILILIGAKVQFRPVES